MRDRASIILGVVIMAWAGWAIYAAIGWPFKAKLFPMAIAITVLCLVAAEVAWSLFGSQAAERATDFQMSAGVPREVAVRRTVVVVAWILGFFAVIALIGFPYAVPLFVFVYLKVQGRESWWLSIAFSAAMWGLFYGLFVKLLNIPFPAGWLF
jgi:hypothetical protein